jgi:uncharacterized damage-inducible protein DinB
MGKRVILHQSVGEIMNEELARYCNQWKSALGGEAWIDETFEKKFEVVNEENAFRQPLPGVHSVAQLVSHLVEWQISIFNIWKGGKRTVTMESALNWLDNATLQTKGWSALKDRFEETQEQMMQFLSAQDDGFLQKVDAEGHTNKYYLEGIIDHNLYHLGQIGLILSILKHL